MSSCSHAVFAVYLSAAALALAGLWPNTVEAQPLVYEVDSINKFEENVEIIKMIMFTDQMWWPVLKGTVQLKLDRDIRPLDHYSSYALNDDTTPFAKPVEPFTVIVGLMKISSDNPEPRYLGSHVKIVMETVKCALTCSILRHLSFQGLLVSRLLSEVDERCGASLQFVIWLEKMIRLSIDKLAALEISQLEVAEMHFYTRQLLNIMESENRDSPDDRQQIKKISEIMYEILKIRCVKPNEPVYQIFVEDLKRIMGPEVLKQFHTMVTNERLSGVPEMNNMQRMLNHQGPLTINGNVQPSNLAQLKAKELKKLMTANWVWMMFVYLNLPMNTMADEQWANLFQRKPMDVDKVENIVRHNIS